MPKPLFIALLLGSFDPLTKGCMEKIKEEIVRTFASENVYALMLDNLEIYEAGAIQVLAEMFSLGKATFLVFESTDLINIEDVDLQKADLDLTAYSYLKEKFNVENVKKASVIDKLTTLLLIARVILLIREKEETRGGEYLELMHALVKGNGDKIWFFKKEGIDLSVMLMEYLDKHKVVMRSYRSEQDLKESVIRVIAYRRQDSVPVKRVTP